MSTVRTETTGKDSSPQIPTAGTAAMTLHTEDERIQFLLRASEILSSSLNYEITLQSIANLVVPTLAEWCTVHIRQKDGAIEQLALAHADPKMVRYARELNERYPSDYSAPRGIGEVLRSGKPEMISHITDEMIVAGAKDKEHLRITRSLGLSSYICVPMIAHGTVLGAITFLASHGKRYNETDLGFAQSLGYRAALAMENARLYREITHLNEGLEQKIQERTEQLRISQAKDRSNLHRLKTMLSHLPLAALMMDEDHVIMELNEEYCRTFHIGLSAAEAMKLDPMDLNERFKKCLLHPEEHLASVMRIIDKRKTVLGQEILLKDGRIVQRDFLSIEDKDRCLGYLFLYRDVTRERRMDAAKSEFMSLASHQLRTPLTSMRWALSMLHRSLGSKASEFEQKLLSEGREGVTRMAGTIDTMLHISRLEAGEMRIETADIQVRGFLQELVRFEEKEFAHKQQSISIDCPQDLRIQSDPSLLKELLGNLINNAFKYTPENGTIRLVTEKKGSTVTFVIQDSGYGIPRHQQAHLFKKFFRGDNVVDKDTKGTGLGLYLVSLLTGLLGGEIDIVSAEGRGTTVTLAFPSA